jgi:hypothetical protein
MSLRRKSIGKSSSRKQPQTVGHRGSPSLQKGLKSVKRPSAAVIDSNLDAFLDTSSLVGPPLSTGPDGSESALKKVEEAKQRLGNLECEIISALFPQTGDPETFESLAVRLGMSIKEVREVADNALRGLRGTKGSPPRPSSVWN